MEEHSKKCIKCKDSFIWFEKEAWWDYQGTEPVKLTRCPYCGTIQALKYEELINPNFDERYYK